MTGKTDMEGISEGTGEGGRWLTYAEFAQARGISKASAIRMVNRRGWQRRPGNDGTARILVPTEALSPPQSQGGRRGGQTAPDAREDAGEDAGDGNALLAGALTALEDALGAANARADEALKRADVAVALADRTLAQLADAGARADRAETARQSAEGLIASLEADLRAKDVAIVDAEARAQEVEQAARIATDALNAARRTEEARKARGRLRRAWDGWRGR
jgi:hypothetical protein